MTPNLIDLTAEIIYPDSNGDSLAENTEQFDWIVIIKEGLEDLYKNDPDVFVAGDLFWYPVEGEPHTRTAPDTMVVLGRPKGKRDSYQQWREGNIPPQVVFEIRSPRNSDSEMQTKLEFYEQHGVKEYYIYDPQHHTLEGWLRQGRKLLPITQMHGWVSPRLKIRFEFINHELKLYRPDGQVFISYVQMSDRAEQAERQLQALLAKLRANGIDPDKL